MCVYTHIHATLQVGHMHMGFTKYLEPARVQTKVVLNTSQMLMSLTKTGPLLTL